MSIKFNNYSLSNTEIEKILIEFEPLIKIASKINGKYNDDCAQKIRISIYRKLCKNRK